MIDVSRVIKDPRLSQKIDIFRKSGKWERGRFVEAEKKIQLQGTISVASPKDLQRIPEGDRVGGEIVIHTTEKIFQTRKGNAKEGSGTSDEILWDGERYKIYSVFPYSDFGFYKAIAMRKESC